MKQRWRDNLKTLVRLSTWLAITTPFGCSSSDLPDYFKLGGMRVLAIKAIPSEVDPSASTPVTLTPLISDLGGGSRWLNYSFVTCIDPAVAVGGSPTCEGNPTATPPVTGTVTFPDSTRTGTGTLTPALPAVTVPSAALIFRGRSSVDQYNGVPYLVLFTLTAPGGETATSFRRIIATTRTPINSAPSLVAIKANNAALSSLPSQEADLTPDLGATAAETYSVQGSGGNTIAKKEQITVSWFISDGSLKRSHTDFNSSNHWTPPTAGTGSAPLFLVGVVRDDRGALDYKIVGP